MPATLTYSSVVSRDLVRIALTVAALNELDILVCDIEGAYISRPNVARKCGSRQDLHSDQKRGRS
jgi:hypothetical protein